MTAARKRLAIRIGAGTAVLLFAAVAAHHAIPHTHGTAIPVPPAAEFGFGPRISADGHYTATLNPERVTVGRMQTMRLALSYPGGQPVTDAFVAVDGGMPQHGHGLPTRPRATALPGEGLYQVDGLKFNMGGWWVLTFHVHAAAGPDSITFNLAL